MNTVRLALTLVGVVVLASGCGGGGSPTGNGGGGGSSGFTATINGQAWASNGAPYLQVTTGPTPGTLVIQGQQLGSGGAYRSITLVLGRIEGTGSYPLGVDGSTVAGGTGNLLISTGAGSAVGLWATRPSGGDGTVTVTSLTATQIVGTFSFTAHPLPGQQGNTQSVTNGEFNLTLPAGFAVATGNHRASKMSGMIGGQAWNAASVASVGDVPFVLMSGSNQVDYQVIIHPQPGLSTGQFPLAQGTTVRIFPVGVANSWGHAGSTGSVFITSFSPSRVVGTFDVNLTPLTPGPGNLAVTGAFDINLALTN